MRNLILWLGAVLMALASCQKEEDLPEAARLFRPVAKEGLVSEANWVSASWQNITGATSYTVQISRDNFSTIDATINVDTSYAVFNDLKWNQMYQVQVRANAQDSIKNSKFSNLGGIKTPKFPTILISPTADDVSDEAIKVKWTNSGAAVTSIKVLNASDSSLVKEVAISNADVTSQYKIVSGLASASSYIVYLYSETSLRGWDNYTTKAPLSGTLIDLRSITDRPSVLADTLPLIPNGSTVILKRGLTYNISAALSLNKSVTILSGSDLQVSDAAIIYFTNNFDVAAGSTIDYIKFSNVTLRGSDYASKYVINLSQACNVETISFESCKAEIFRGVARLKDAVMTVNNFVVNDCILDSLAGYGVLAVDNVNCKVNNISIKNSTIYKAEQIITSKQNSNSIVIENCTINESPIPAGYIINYSTSTANNVAQPIIIKNCIFGRPKDKSGVTSLVFNGVRVGSTSSIDASGNYNTSDFTGTTLPIPNLTAYSGSSTTLWQNPAAGDFKIKDNTFAGKSTAGDPRWR